MTNEQLQRIEDTLAVGPFTADQINQFMSKIEAPSMRKHVREVTIRKREAPPMSPLELVHALNGHFKDQLALAKRYNPTWSRDKCADVVCKSDLGRRTLAMSADLNQYLNGPDTLVLEGEIVSKADSSDGRTSSQETAGTYFPPMINTTNDGSGQNLPGMGTVQTGAGELARQRAAHAALKAHADDVAKLVAGGVRYGKADAQVRSANPDRWQTAMSARGVAP